ncbi:hypothetical protein EUGRSUZ_B01753 [Eucalyptus grandis]|uniref:Uncharacterized protein n=2 Tax=Eucalyptus grandis TaxID=71139 RepID=A0ACC3LT48_EUCGR|nr:hypothetical protein EUGRSUZ_B01753 [Eucalyptus grandis]
MTMFVMEKVVNVSTGGKLCHERHLSSDRMGAFIGKLVAGKPLVGQLSWTGLISRYLRSDSLPNSSLVKDCCKWHKMYQFDGNKST